MRIQLAIFYLLLGSILKAQNPVLPLALGEKVPEIYFSTVLNYPTKKAKLSDFGKKLILLDFWTSSCMACIQSFPKMDSLQKKFGDNLQILLVNPHQSSFESAERIQKVLEKVRLRTGNYPGLPIPIFDTILNRYFPHDGVPHVIWISQEGILIGITESEYVTEENILAILSGKTVSLPVKNDRAFDETRPLFIKGNGGNDEFIYRLVITGYQPQLGKRISGRRANTSGELSSWTVTGYYLVNYTLPALIESAYNEEIKRFPESKRFYELKDPLLATLPTNLYCYDLTIQPTDWDSFNESQFIKEDLKRVFNISIRIEKRTIQCLVVRSTDKVSKSFTRYVKPGESFFPENIQKYLHHYSVDQVLNDYLQPKFHLPFINETNLDQPIDLNFPDHFNLSDEKAILALLKKAGFTIQEEERVVDVVIISDR